FDQLVVMPLSAIDQKELVALLGADPTAPPARPKLPDPRRPLAEETADQVAKSVGKLETPTGQKLAVVVPNAPIRSSPALSKEIKQFIDANRDHRPGAIAVFLMVRTSP